MKVKDFKYFHSGTPQHNSIKSVYLPIVLLEYLVSKISV